VTRRPGEMIERRYKVAKREMAMHYSCMATKTISLELDAYEHLKAAKGPGESFSDVVRRATFQKRHLTAQDLLSQLQKRGAMFSESDLKDLEKTHDKLSTLPDDPWRTNR
jgi:predicted CopG family antitoxin